MNERVPQLAGRAVLILSTLLAAVEVGRVGLTASATDIAVAIAATIAFLPLHLWHLSYGVRGERPPHSGATLALVALINLVALLVIGESWAFMLAVVATSALIVLRPPWSLAALVACLAAAGGVVWIDPDAHLSWSSTASYLMYSVLFRAAIQFAIVWLVAAVHQLAASRTALAADAVLAERAQLQREVRASLERHIAALRDAGRRARAALGAPGVAEPLLALDGVLAQANDALRDLRAIVTETAAEDRCERAAAALVSSARARQSPIGRGLATRQAWRTLVSVHALALLFPLLMAVGAFGFNAADRPALAVVAWACVAALTLSTSRAVVQGRAPSRPVLRVAAATVLAFGGVALFGIAWETTAWFVPITAVACLRGRVRIAVAVLAPAAMLVYDTLQWESVADPTTYALCWNAAYWLVVSTLVVAGMCASVRLVPLVAELDAARDALAAGAVRTERRRLSRDLHDVVGQSLTAIALKGDLARRLIEADRAGAEREVAELEAVARSLADDVAAVARDAREVAFATEAGAAIDLLRLAGIEVVARLEVDGLCATSAALGFAMREGATNILRHARARECTILAAHGPDGVVRLELVNDGALSRSGCGTGLQSLAERLAELDGRAAGGPIGDGRFRLQVEVPA